MNDYQISILEELYDHCQNLINSKKKMPLIIMMLSSRKNTVKSALMDSAYHDELNSSMVRELVNEGYLREISPTAYILTARGLYFVESEVKKIPIENYLDWIDQEYLHMDNEEITERNRVILLALFAARCFTKDTAASYANMELEKTFMTLLNDSAKFLSNLCLVKSDVLDSGKGTKSKSNVATILGQIDKLPSSTGMKFKANSNKSYYLDVIDDGKVDRKAITFLTKVILGDKLNVSTISDLKCYCEKQYMEFGFIFRTGSSRFDDTITKFQIMHGMDDAII